ncbi:MAG: HNH endonuclease signature motif containing protein, partial [Bacteroidota bacterium]
GNLLLGAAASQGGNVGNLYALDAALGTNTVGATEGFSNAVDGAVNKLTSGDPISQGEVVGEVLWGVAEGVVGSKGTGLLSKTKVANKLKLPATMVDELPAYKSAAKDGNLIKTSTKGMSSNARSTWEKAHGRKIPSGFDVDHIIQKQFGGTDDLSNLQLKKSSLNRSEGVKAYHLNKQHPHGTKFKSVEIDD